MTIVRLCDRCPRFGHHSHINKSMQFNGMYSWIT
nr:MAG TPA: hypothetical protein [Caudoviricetes sp.]